MNLCLHILGWEYIYDDDDTIVGKTCRWCKDVEWY